MNDEDEFRQIISEVRFRGKPIVETIIETFKGRYGYDPSEDEIALIYMTVICYLSWLKNRIDEFKK